MARTPRFIVVRNIWIVRSWVSEAGVASGRRSASSANRSGKRLGSGSGSRGDFRAYAASLLRKSRDQKNSVFLHETQIADLRLVERTKALFRERRSNGFASRHRLPTATLRSCCSSKGYLEPIPWSCPIGAVSQQNAHNETSRFTEYR